MEALGAPKPCAGARSRCPGTVSKITAALGHPQVGPLWPVQSIGEARREAGLGYTTLLLGRGDRAMPVHA